MPKLDRIFHRSKGLAHRTRRASSFRSAMFIATSRGGCQAPSGAAYYPTTPSSEPAMPLLTELENCLVRPPVYKHGAPNGAFLPASHWEVSKLDLDLTIL